MNPQLVKQLNQLFFKHITLFHYKVGVAFNKNDNKFKCNKNQQKALFVIKMEKRMIQGDLGKCLDLSKGALTSLIDSLENKGLINRVNDSKDRRKHWVVLTDIGEVYTDSMMRLYEEEMLDKFKKIDDEDAKEVIEHLQFLIDFMEKL